MANAPLRATFHFESHPVLKWFLMDKVTTIKNQCPHSLCYEHILAMAGFTRK